MKRIILLVICCLVCVFYITGCREKVDKTDSTLTTTIDTKAVKKEVQKEEDGSLGSISKSKKEIKEITDKNIELKYITLMENDKNELIKTFLEKRIIFTTDDDINFGIPSEIRIIKKWDKYDALCYSVYKCKNENIYVFMIREKYNPQKSVLYSPNTVYEGLFIMPVDKLYSIENFKDIVVNKSDLSDVKKIYKYADVLIEQELRLSNSKKKCSIDILSKDSCISISFKKSGNKYIVTNIKNNAHGWLASKIAYLDKNFN